MIVDWKILILTLPIAVSLILCCYGTGLFLSWLVCRFDKKKWSWSTSQPSIFWNLISGMIFLTSIYAAITTNFKTSLLPVPILAIALMRLETVSLVTVPNSMATPHRISWLYLFIGLLIYWLPFALYFFLPDPGQSFYNNPDTLFYARAADYLNTTGLENVTLDYLGISGSFVEPYHYGDLWITALVQKLTGFPPAWILPLIVYPVLAVIFISGLAQYFRPAGSSKSIVFSYSVMILGGFISGFAFLFPSLVFPQILNLTAPLFTLPKLFLPAIIIIAIALALKKNSWNQAMVVASFGSLLFINIAPAILITLGSIGIVAFFKKNQGRFTITPLYFILSSLGLIYYFLFYELNTTAEVDSTGIPFRIQIFINIIVAGCLHYIPLFPFLILFFLWRNKKNEQGLEKIIMSNDILFLVALPVAGFISWGIFYRLSPEVVQFFSNVFIPVIAITIVYLVIRALKMSIRKLTLLAITLFALSIITNFKSTGNYEPVSSRNKQMVSEFIKEHRPGNFVNIRASREFDKWSTRNTIFIQPLPLITYLHPGYYNISLNPPGIGSDSSWAYLYDKNLLASAPFNVFVKKRDTILSMEEHAYLFVTEYNIPYLAVSPDTTIPVRLRTLVKDSLVLSDNWHIYYLEN